MALGGTHVTFTNSDGGEEVGIVKSYGSGTYSIQKKSGALVSVGESTVKKLEVTTAQKDNCPVVGSA